MMIEPMVIYVFAMVESTFQSAACFFWVRGSAVAFWKQFPVSLDRKEAVPEKH